MGNFDEMEEKGEAKAKDELRERLDKDNQQGDQPTPDNPDTQQGTPS